MVEMQLLLARPQSHQFSIVRRCELNFTVDGAIVIGVFATHPQRDAAHIPGAGYDIPYELRVGVFADAGVERLPVVHFADDRVDLRLAPLADVIATAVVGGRRGVEDGIFARHHDPTDPSTAEAHLAREGVAKPLGHDPPVEGDSVVVLAPGDEPFIAAVDGHGEIRAGDAALELELACHYAARRAYRPAPDAGVPHVTRPALAAGDIGEYVANPVEDLLKAGIVGVFEDAAALILNPGAAAFLPVGQDVGAVAGIVAEMFLGVAGWADARAFAPAFGAPALEEDVVTLAVHLVAGGGLTIPQRHRNLGEGVAVAAFDSDGEAEAVAAHDQRFFYVAPGLFGHIRILAQQPCLAPHRAAVIAERIGHVPPAAQVQSVADAHLHQLGRNAVNLLDDVRRLIVVIEPGTEIDLPGMIVDAAVSIDSAVLDRPGRLRVVAQDRRRVEPTITDVGGFAGNGGAYEISIGAVRDGQRQNLVVILAVELHIHTFESTRRTNFLQHVAPLVPERRHPRRRHVRLDYGEVHSFGILRDVEVLLLDLVAVSVSPGGVAADAVRQIRVNCEGDEVVARADDHGAIVAFQAALDLVGEGAFDVGGDALRVGIRTPVDHRPETSVATQCVVGQLMVPAADARLEGFCDATVVGDDLADDWFAARVVHLYQHLARAVGEGVDVANVHGEGEVLALRVIDERCDAVVEAERLPLGGRLRRAGSRQEAEQQRQQCPCAHSHSISPFLPRVLCVHLGYPWTSRAASSTLLTALSFCSCGAGGV